MAGVEIGGAERAIDREGQPTSAHEIERTGHAVGEIGVGFRLRRAGDRLQHPLMDVLDAGVAALGEGAQQIERRRRLAVGLDLPARIRAARLLGEGDVVDDVAAVARQFLAVAFLRRRRARLGELPRSASDLHHRQGPGISEHDRHLQKDAEEVADIVGAVLGEALGAVAALQQESLAVGDARQRLLQAARLTGKDQRRKSRKLLFDVIQRLRVRIIRHLLDRFLAPAIGRPTFGHHEYSNQLRGLYTRLPAAGQIVAKVG